MAAQDSFEITFDQARALGRQSVLDGRPADALELANTLLQADDRDADAWLIRAAALLQLSQNAEAREAASRAYRLAPTSGRKYEAARLAALAASNDERFALAQWWLRLALIDAPSEADAAQTRQDAVQVRSNSPWRTNVQLSFYPSDNVNGGTTEETYTVNGQDLQFGGVPFERNAPILGRALSGWRGTLDLETTYILNQSTTERTALNARFGTQQVILSDEAQAFLDENLTDEEQITDDYFNFSSLDFEIQHARVLEDGFFSVSAGVLATWQSGERLDNGISLGANYVYTLSPTQQLSTSGSVERRWSVETGDFRDDRASLTLRYRQQLQDLGTIGIGLGYAMRDGVEDVSNYDRWTLSLDYAPSEPVGPMNVVGIVGISHTDYPVYIDLLEREGMAPGFVEIPGGRQEDRVFGRLIATFPTYDFAGFVPVVTLDVARTSSNIGRFERDDATLGLSFRSSF